MVDKAMFSSENDNWETPAWLFNILDQWFNFTLDACATEQNAKVAHFFSPEQDGLAQSWGEHVVWCNPPYGRAIGAWVRKGHESAIMGATVVMLLPARTDTRWWWNHVRHAEVRLLPGRLRFELGGKTLNSAPYPSAIAIWRPSDIEGRILHWRPR